MRLCLWKIGCIVVEELSFTQLYLRRAATFTTKRVKRGIVTSMALTYLDSDPPRKLRCVNVYFCLSSILAGLGPVRTCCRGIFLDGP